MKLGVAYIPPHQPQHLESDLHYMREIGCTDVLFALQENHFQWLNGAVRFGGQLAHDAGLRPTAVIWGYANTSGGGRSSRVMLEHPEMWRQDTEGKPYGGGYPHPMLCYNHPLAVKCYADYIRQSTMYGFEGILLDEPTTQDCFCPCCRERFQRDFQGDLLAQQDTPAYKQFQADTVADFVARSCDVVKEINPRLEVSLCIMPQDHHLFAAMASLNHLDVFSTDPYWLRPINQLTLDDSIRLGCYARQLAHENAKSFTLFLGCFGIAAGMEPLIYQEGRQLVEAVQPDSLITWSFRGGIGLSDLSSEECDNPELAWQHVVKLYENFSA